MRHSAASNFWCKMRLVVISAVYVMISASVKADDTEIYLASASITPVQPNILFVMDTSGSMSLPPVADLLAGNLTAPAKIEQMKTALAQLIGSLNNVNVGLMRFSAYETKDVYEAGGPVLYPVRDINAGVDPLVYSYIASSEDDGVETPAGGVVLDQGAISMTNDALDCPGCQVSTFIPLTGDNNLILGNQTNPALAVLGQDGDYLGLRYQVDIPRGVTIYSAQIKFTAAANNSDAKYSEPLLMSHDWRRANYSSYPADTDPFVNGVQLDNIDPSNLSGGVGDWHGYRKWDDSSNPNPQSNSSGSLVPVFVEGNEYASNVKWSIEWSLAQSGWDSGDHMMYRFYREKLNWTECTDNAVSATTCGVAPTVLLVPGYLPAPVPQPDDCADAVCNNNCGTAPIIELVPGYLPAPVPQPDDCADAVCNNNCGTAPIIELVPGYWPAPVPQPDDCADPVCTDMCGTAPIIELVPGYWPAPIPQPDDCADAVCTDMCGAAPIIELVPGYWPDPVPQEDTCIPDGEGGENCYPNDDVQPPYVDAVMGPDPSWIPVFADPVCTPVADVQPPYVDAVTGPDPSYIPVFADPVCTPVADVQPPYVDAVLGPDPSYIPTFDAPVCTPVADVQPPYVDAVLGPDPSYIPTFDAPVCTPVADVQPPYVDDVFGPQPDYEAIYTPMQDFSSTPAVRNAHGLQSGTPPVLEVVWLPNDTDNKVALRFDEVFVPQGATITSAFIEFETKASTVDTDLDIYAEKVDNSSPLLEANSNIGSRPLTSSHVDWDDIIEWTDDADDHKTTPNLANLVEEVVAQGGWCGGNAMTFVLSGSGSRKFKSFDYGSGAVPRLKVRFDEASSIGGCNSKKSSSVVTGENSDINEATAGSGFTAFFAEGFIYNGANWMYAGAAAQGFRFTNIRVPQGATILSAYLVKTAALNASSSTSITVGAANLDDMAPFTLTSGELTALPKVASTAVWNLEPWTAGTRYKSDDFSAVIQDVVNRSGWESGNAMGILTQADGQPYGFSTTHTSNSGGTDKGAELHITYDAPFEEGTRTVRDELIDLVAGLTAQGATPVSGVLAEAASYYRGEDVYFGQNRGFATDDEQRRYYRTSHSESFSGGSRNLPAGCYDTESSIKECHAETLSGTAEYVSPIADICQTNNIVLLSDGVPNTHFSSAQNIIEPIIVGDANDDDGFTGYSNCDSSEAGDDCSLKLAEALANEDQETVTFNGIQTVQTHTIGFDLASGGSAADFLEELAERGKGGAYSADNATGLVDVFEAIVRSLEREARTFVSAGVSVNQANRLTHRDELYFGLFKPDTDTVWSGNLKRYRLIDGLIHDVVPAVAVNEEGRFKDLARSFWSGVIDGDAVEIGGAASLMTNSRNIYSNITGDPLTDDNNKVHEDNVNILEADVAATGVSDREDILRWARGVDGAGNAREEMGDPLHSRPLVVTYDDGSATGNPQVFVGTNQGYLHAIDTETGVENWSFIPKDLLPNLTLFEKNSVVANHVYGLDGSITIAHDDKDHDSLVDSDETAILYIGMRRGGRNYYAIDISDRLNPTLKFIIEGGSGDYAELGQTWSKLTFGTIQYNGSDREVLVFGGGYDNNQDTAGAHLSDTVGRTVFIADADTGALIWNARVNSNAPAAGTSAVSNLSNSIPSDIKAVDLSGSGYIEHIYASDTAGQVFRFDVDNYGNSGTSDLVTGGLLASLQTGAATEENNRRFFYAPDVAAIKRPNYVDFIAVSIGSGYRAHPVNNETNDKFYVIRDEWVLDGRKFPATFLDEDDLADVSTIIGDGNSDGVSDALALIENPGTPKYGWFIDFLQTGEKVLAESVTFDEKIIFTTYHPNLNGVGTGICEAPEGSSRAYVLNIVDGTPALDNNDDGDEDDLTTGDPDTTSCGDRCTDIGRGIPSSGLVLFQPEGATICFGTQCFPEMLSFQGERLQRVKWRRKNR